MALLKSALPGLTLAGGRTDCCQCTGFGGLLRRKLGHHRIRVCRCAWSRQLGRIALRCARASSCACAGRSRRRICKLARNKIRFLAALFGAVAGQVWSATCLPVTSGYEVATTVSYFREDRATQPPTRLVQPLLDADPQSFQVLRRSVDERGPCAGELQPPWRRDRNGVYYRDQAMPDVDLASFKATGLDRGEDRNGRFSGPSRVCKSRSDDSAALPLCP